ncbi:DUF2637 domain-containing protein [Streptomyces sp. NPDC087422]|uniref:DUF2637 domain-containing protein n=1 Tax=Streptomyces sp. NPDC087422 TaxID=3365786 RepID=UPI003822A126
MPDRPRHRSLPFDRLVLLLLGACGCVLSFDSLRQVALATHVRADLSYLFPVVIDGFIAYGVRAILLLRDAPRSARLYAWTLFGAATAASLWANSLHSLRVQLPGHPRPGPRQPHRRRPLDDHPDGPRRHPPPPHPGHPPRPHAAAGIGDGRNAERGTARSGRHSGRRTDNFSPSRISDGPGRRSLRTESVHEPYRPEPFRSADQHRPPRPSSRRLHRRAGRGHRQRTRPIRPDNPGAAREAIQAAGLSAGNDRIAQALAQLAQDQPPSAEG